RSQPSGSATENPSGARYVRKPGGRSPVPDGDGVGVAAGEAGADGGAVSRSPGPLAPPGASEPAGADIEARGGASAAVAAPVPGSPWVAASTATSTVTTARVVPRTRVLLLHSRLARRSAAARAPRGRRPGAVVSRAPGAPGAPG